MPLSLTIDLEDPTERYDPAGRYVALTERLLALCAETNRRATFFTIGKLAQAAPDLIRQIAAQGHEIAWHSRAHVSLTDTTPERFAQEAAEDKDRLEQLAGRAVTGFRAPRFSLTPQTLWATEALKAAGFAYSSSIMPTTLSRFGFPQASAAPFRWPCGLWELPLPMAKIGRWRVPYSGGIYLYAMPRFLTDFFLRRAEQDECLWTYAHPYDFDAGESYIPMPNTPLWVSLILWAARQRAESQIRHILKNDRGDPLACLVERLDAL